MLHIGKYFGYIGHGAIRILGYLPKINEYLKNKEETTLEERYNHARLRIDDVLHNILRVKLQVTGLEKLDDKETYLITPNHQGMLDPLCLINLLKDPVIIVSKKESKKYPVVGKVIDIIDGIYLDRESPRDALKMVKACNAHLKEKRNVIIFPEGTRSKNETVDIQEYKPGAFKCAYSTGAKILPVVFDESYLPLSITKKNNKEKVIKISFLDPISSEEYETYNTNDLAKLVETRAKEELARMRSK
ncbi:MAG: 1-acyl-sn-glycerol-3-phosphate acyltransferase [Bacilli bacterium]|nr:1-acyl-sn-glycerol-3-phosphate acyltransferase [Bacilli bacterium]